MLPQAPNPHQHAVSDSDPQLARDAVLRLARLVAEVAALPGDAQGQRKQVRSLARVLKACSAELSLTDGGLTVDGERFDAPEDDRAAVQLLADRMQAYGVESFTLAKAAAEADLGDLARLLATAPTQEDPPSVFAARAAAIDLRSIPRRLRSKPVAEAPPLEARSPEPQQAQRPSRAPTPAVSTAAVARPARPTPAATPVAEHVEPLPVVARPDTEDDELRALLDRIAAIDAVDELPTPLEELAARADLDFRTGRMDRMLESLTGLLAMESLQLARDGSDACRQAFSRAVRRLARPVLLRQLAWLRHARASVPLIVERVELALGRFGTDGADALIDEWMTAPTPEAQLALEQALQAHRRTHDALFELMRATDHLLVRRAAELLGRLGGSRSEKLLLEALRHPEAAVRRAVVASLAGFESAEALDAIGLALLDDEVAVRLQAAASLATKGETAVKLLMPAIDGESEREVLATAMASLGRIGSPDAVQLLIRCALGETAHPHAKRAAYRLQACSVLVLVRTPQAMATVQGLRNDRDRELRQGSQRLLQQAVRRTTGAMRAVSAP